MSDDCAFVVRVDTNAGGGLQVCISDSALSRDIFPHDYHCLGDNENRPVKWLAFEALVARNFSTASDMVRCCTSLTQVCSLFRYQNSSENVSKLN